MIDFDENSIQEDYLLFPEDIERLKEAILHPGF